MINKWIGIGNLTADPEVRYAQSGTAIASFTVATTTGRGEYEHTEFAKCVTFGKLAEICGEYLSKGSKVYVEGMMKTRKWQDRDDKTRYTTEINVEVMKMLSSRASREGNKNNEPPPTGDDVPF